MRLVVPVADGYGPQGAEFHGFHAHVGDGSLGVFFKVGVVEVGQHQLGAAQHHDGDMTVQVVAAEMGFVLHKVRIWFQPREGVIDHFKHQLRVEPGVFNVCCQFFAWTFVHIRHSCTSLVWVECCRVPLRYRAAGPGLPVAIENTAT